ncbi:MAG TPA: class I SAM-dependent methyltransferase [Candidatus Sulfotelmatobacter sp.]|nr:class I SAM-dependent methyltransferase [Candidatus Sulfotelmatobacter sp.]
MGAVDVADGSFVRGWAYDVDQRVSARVRIAVDGQLVGEVRGRDYRPDLADAGLGDGRCGFAFRLPRRLRERPFVVTARFTSTGSLLIGGERLVGGVQLAKAELFQSALANGVWRIDSLRSSGDVTVLSGWGVPPYGVAMPVSLLRDGVLPLSFASVDRPDVAAFFGLETLNTRFGFEATFASVDDEDGDHAYRFVSLHTSAPFGGYQGIHYWRERLVMPDEGRRRRVAGTPDRDMFRRIGGTTYARLDRALQQYFGRSFADATAILDWGSGCGRVLRYVPALQAVTGIDIDADNVAWCRENIPGARFELVPLRPPTGLPSDTFDVAFGISVMTHLTEENHHEWLAELQRVTAPGAAVLLTIHGEMAWLEGQLPLEQYARWRMRGYYVAGKNSDLDDSGADASLYYNTFVSRRYVFEEWSRYFEVLDVIPGAVFNQDLAVLRRR